MISSPEGDNGKQIFTVMEKQPVVEITNGVL